ncbi:MAG TPA: energy transducer TonB [Rhizomicrobium sp.]|nr:energy transducer TonB [Rhizomicrobium sp.]
MAENVPKCRGLSAAAALMLLASPVSAGEAMVDHTYPAPAPTYPASAQFTGAQGDVLVDVFVSARGLPRKIRINTSSGNSALDNAAVEAVAGWHFVPATQDGDTASSWKSLKIHFQLPQVVQIPPQGMAGQPPATAPAQKR